MRSRLVLTLWCAGVLCGPAWAEAPLADRLPEGTLAYLGWAGKTAALEQSAAGKLLRLPVVKKVLDTIQAAAKENLRGQELTAFQHGWQLGMTALKHPLAVALVDFQMPEQGQEGPPKFLAAVLADLGKDKAEFDKHLAVLLALAGEEIQTEQAAGPGGVAYTRLIVRGGPPMCYGYVGNVFFGCIGGPPDALLKTKAASSLATSAAFKKYFGPMDGENVQSAIYIHAAPILKQIDPMLGPPLGQEPADGRHRDPSPRKIMAALGVDKITALAGAGRIEGGAMVSAAKLYTPAPHKGLLMLAAGGVLKPADLAHGPGADADLAIAFKLSPSAVWKEIRRAVRTIEPRAEEDLLEGVNELNQIIKVRLAEELLPLLGDTWVLSSATSQGGFLTGTALTVTLTDEAKFRDALAKIEAALAEQMTPPPPPPGAEEGRSRPRRRRGPQLRYTTIQGVKVTYLQFVGEPIPVAPAWTVHKGRLYVALWPQVAATAALGPAEGKRLVDNARFQALWKKTAEGASVMVYCDFGSILTQAYNLALLGWTAGANELTRELNMPIKPDWLPLLDELVKHFPPSMSSVTPQEDGILCRSVSNLPVPGLSLLPVMGVGMFWGLHAETVHEPHVYGRPAIRAETGRATDRAAPAPSRRRPER